MTVKRLHTKSKIFVPNPYVIRIDHEHYAGDGHPPEYKKALQIARKQIFGTWGYCQPEYELVINGEEPAPPQNNLQMIASLFTSHEHVMRSYWFFEDEMDALQFRLSLGERAIHVHIWPKRVFTIYEVVEADES